MFLREIDVLIAEEIMNVEIEDVDGVRYYEGFCDPKQYSKDIKLAWEVIEQLSKQGVYIRISNVTGRGKYRAATEGGITDFCETAPVAICLAALRRFHERQA